MPNWVRNNVSVMGDKDSVDLFAQRHFRLSDGELEPHKEFDFRTIKPMPDRIFQGNLGEEERKKYGEDNWYDWSINNWGTKWNACDTHVDGITQFSDSTAEMQFFFNTAWSCPEEIYTELGKLYPHLKFDIEFADEDIGRNCGIVTIDKGETSFNYLEDEEFASDVWNYSEEYTEEENEQMKTKEEMIELIIKKNASVLTIEELTEFKTRLESQDNVSVWETYVKNCEV